MNAIERLRAVLCAPDSTVSIHGSDGDRAIIHDALTELDALTPAPQVPEGMVLVPREPTPEMVEVICDRHAGKSVWPDDYGHPARAIRRRQAREGYRAMLAVAALNEPFGNAEQLTSLEQRDSESMVIGKEGQAILAQCIAGHGAIVGYLTAGRPDLALAEARQWVEGFMEAARIARENGND